MSTLEDFVSRWPDSQSRACAAAGAGQSR